MKRPICHPKVYCTPDQGIKNQWTITRRSDTPLFRGMFCVDTGFRLPMVFPPLAARYLYLPVVNSFSQIYNHAHAVSNSPHTMSSLGYTRRPHEINTWVIWFPMLVYWLIIGKPVVTAPKSVCRETVARMCAMCTWNILTWLKPLCYCKAAILLSKSLSLMYSCSLLHLSRGNTLFPFREQSTPWSHRPAFVTIRSKAVDLIIPPP